jgi:hypothetical protein
MRRALAIMLFMTPAAVLPVACSQPSRICDLICECEHCNDITEEYKCQAADASQEIAEVYGCEDDWEAYGDCIEDEGECDEDEARFSTREPGKCNASYDSGITCMDDPDCLGIGNGSATCGAGMTCEYQACNDGNGIPCNADDECSGGENRCADEEEKLAECLSEASDDQAYVFIDFD